MPLRCVAHRRGDAARAAPERPGAAGRNAGTEFLTTFTISVPEGTSGRPWTIPRRARRGAQGAGRAGASAAVVAAARPFARAGPVERRESRRDAGVLEVAAHGSVDDRRDHAAQPAPKRPGDDHPVTRNDRGSPSSPEGLRASAPAWWPGTSGATGRWWPTPGRSGRLRTPDVLTVEGDIAKRANRRPDRRGCAGAVSAASTP